MDYALPEIGEGVYEAELVRWLVRPGDRVKRGQPLLEVMTDKATMEVPSSFAGVIDAHKAQPGDKVKVGQVLLSYDTGQPVAASTRTEEPTPKTEPVARPARVNGPAVSSDLAVRAAPSVRHLARKLGIDLAGVRGSGPQGRILIDDLKDPARFIIGQAVQPDTPAGRPEPKPDYGKPGTRIKMQGLRRKIAERLVHSKHTIPHYSYIDECDTTDLVRLRTSLKEVYARAGVKLTYLPFFVKAVVSALKEVPIVNASYDEEGGEIVLHDRYHIGIAVATPAGLIVPVIKDADKRDIAGIAREIDRLSNEARAGKAKLDDLRGGTFTITSVGNIGGLISTPVINHPEVGILGIGKVVKRPVFDADGQVKPAEIVYLSFSFDHRVVDGAVGAVFGNAVLKAFQNPARLLLPEKL